MSLRSIRLFSGWSVFAGVGIATWLAACGSSNGSQFTDPNANRADSGAGPNTSSGSLASSGDPGSSGGNGDGGDNQSGDLRIDPPTITITATGTLSSVSGSQSFKAYVGTSPTPVDAIWSVDDAGIGSIDQTGLFKTATSAGQTKVIAKVGNLTVSASVNVIFKIEEDLAGNIDAATKTKLKGGGGVDTAFKWIYPYDRTVFPRGLLPPKLMFAGAAADAFYVRLSTKNVDYSGYYPGANGGQPRIIISDDWWTMVTRSAGLNDPVSIQVTKIAGGNVTGPVSETWSVAQGSLKGTVFYNTYNSTLVNAAQASGAVMRLKPGSNVEVFIGKKTVTTTQSDGTTSQTTSTCTVCHSVSANGTALVAGLNWGDNGNPYDSAIFSISATGDATPRASTFEGRQNVFGGLSPDGNWLVGNAAAYMRGLSGAYPSRLYNAQTGALVKESFFGSGDVGTGDRKAIAPSFSPDSKHLAFGDREANADGHRISLVDVDLTQSPPMFSNNVTLATDPGHVVGWPSFLPDSKGVVFGAATTYDTGTFTSTAQLGHQCGELQWVDTGTKLASPLQALNGYQPDGTCYLPFCSVPDPDTANNVPNPCNTEDAHMNYEPTVLPVAVGGYYWVVFTSRRAYGNFISRIPGASVSANGDVPFDNTQDEASTSQAVKGFRKKLWVAAIDINGQPGTDVSHPAFLLEGQEIAAGNMRGFWALDPCKKLGEGCSGGSDCCDGFCRSTADGDGGTVNQCVVPPTGCANDGEKCSIAADCCDAASGTTCVNGFCTAPTPPPIK